MWELSFISEEDFSTHISETIDKYGKKLKSFDLKRFNKNIVDPVKLIFDKAVYKNSWEEIIKSEIFRQRDKSNNNDIGYFHQNIFKYIDNCTVPKSGWDVIYEDKEGIELPDGSVVSRVYVEMKNKHNTMNSSSSSKTYIKMQNQILKDDDCACFLVEAIAKNSQNIKWVTKVDGDRVEHKNIRRVSIDQFYSMVTGESDAFYKMCMILPKIIDKTITEKNSSIVPKDTVYEDLFKHSEGTDLGDYELSMAMAIYLLGFSTYIGFKKK